MIFCSNHEFVTLWSGASLKMTKKWHILAPTVKCYEFVIKKKLFPPWGGKKKNVIFTHIGGIGKPMNTIKKLFVQ